MKKTFTIEVDGKEYTYNVIKILNNAEFNHNYIIYTDGNDIFASRYEIINEKVILDNIEDNKEWDYINKMMNPNNN